MEYTEVIDEGTVDYDFGEYERENFSRNEEILYDSVTALCANLDAIGEPLFKIRSKAEMPLLKNSTTNNRLVHHKKPGAIGMLFGKPLPKEIPRESNGVWNWHRDPSNTMNIVSLAGMHTIYSHFQQALSDGQFVDEEKMAKTTVISGAKNRGVRLKNLGAARYCTSTVESPYNLSQRQQLELITRLIDGQEARTLTEAYIMREVRRRCLTVDKTLQVCYLRDVLREICSDKTKSFYTERLPEERTAHAAQNLWSMNFYEWDSDIETFDTENIKLADRCAFCIYATAVKGHWTLAQLEKSYIETTIMNRSLQTYESDSFAMKLCKTLAGLETDTIDKYPWGSCQIKKLGKAYKSQVYIRYKGKVFERRKWVFAQKATFIIELYGIGTCSITLTDSLVTMTYNFHEDRTAEGIAKVMCLFSLWDKRQDLPVRQTHVDEKGVPLPVESIKGREIYIAKDRDFPFAPFLFWRDVKEGRKGIDISPTDTVEMYNSPGFSLESGILLPSRYTSSRLVRTTQKIGFNVHQRVRLSIDPSLDVMIKSYEPQQDGTFKETEEYYPNFLTICGSIRAPEGVRLYESDSYNSKSEYVRKWKILTEGIMLNNYLGELTKLNFNNAISQSLCKYVKPSPSDRAVAQWIVRNKNVNAALAFAFGHYCAGPVMTELKLMEGENYIFDLCGVDISVKSVGGKPEIELEDLGNSLYLIGPYEFNLAINPSKFIAENFVNLARERSRTIEAEGHFTVSNLRHVGVPTSEEMAEIRSKYIETNVSSTADVGDMDVMVAVVPEGEIVSRPIEISGDLQDEDMEQIIALEEEQIRLEAAELERNLIWTSMASDYGSDEAVRTYEVEGPMVREVVWKGKRKLRKADEAPKYQKSTKMWYDDLRKKIVEKRKQPDDELGITLRKGTSSKRPK